MIEGNTPTTCASARKKLMNPGPAISILRTTPDGSSRLAIRRSAIARGFWPSVFARVRARFVARSPWVGSRGRSSATSTADAPKRDAACTNAARIASRAFTCRSWSLSSARVSTRPACRLSPPPVLNMQDAMKATTPKQWDNKFDGTIMDIPTPIKRGDPTKGMNEAEVVVENVSGRSTEQHMPLELTTIVGWWDNDKYTAFHTTQWAHGTRDGLAQALKLPQNKVRVIQTGYMGSGYGFRSGPDLAEIHAAILAKITGRPVRAMATRSEDFVTKTHRPENLNQMKLGVKRDGTLVAGQFKVFANVGAQRAGAASGSWYNMQLLYNIPNLLLEGVDVFTNSYKSGPYRCVGHPNGTTALESIMDMAAYKIGMDPVQFRLKNLNLVGNPENKRP